MKGLMTRLSGADHATPSWHQACSVMRMTSETLRERTTAFAVDVVSFTRELRRTPGAQNIAEQLSDAATAVASNYRCASRARSRREFVSKLAIAVEEADETVGWLEIVARTRITDRPEANPLLREARELLAILAASRRTAERNDPNWKRK